MDFLIAGGMEESVDAKSLQAYCYSELDQLCLNHMYQGVQHLVWASTASAWQGPSQSDRFFCFDGGTSVNEQYFHSHLGLNSPAALAAALARREFPDAGIYCLLSVGLGDEQDVYVAIDWLCQYPLYLWREGRRFALSNNVKMLERLTGAVRSPLPAIENMVTGGVSERHVHLESTCQIPFGRDVHIHQGALSLVPRNLDVPTSFSYSDCLENLRKSISEHVAAALGINDDIDPYIICDLTGGADSRAVLAMVLDHAKGLPVHIRTMGRYPNPDVNVAALIKYRYGLQNGRFPSMAAPMDLAVRFNGLLSGGGREAGATLSPTGFSNLIHFKGCYGEIGGATPGYDFIAEALSAGAGLCRAVDILFDRRKRAGAINFITKDALDLVRKTLIEEYQELIDAGYSTGSLFSERYLRARSRTHFGLLSFAENKSKILPDVLANRWLIECARRLPDSQRSHNKVIYDLIRFSSHGEMAFLPMAGKKWNPNVIAGLDIDLLTAMQVIDSNTPALAPVDEPIYTSVSISPQLAKDYKAIVDAVRGVPSITPQLANLQGHRNTAKVLSELINSNSLIWDYFDKDKLGLELERPSESFRMDGIDVNAIGIFSSVASWLTCRDFSTKLKCIDFFK